MERLLLISLGGAIGTALRYLTSIVAARWFGTEFPYGTLIVNLVGAFVIGLVQQVGTQTLVIPDNTRLFLTTGMMGGLTTYSAFSYETVHLMEVEVPPRNRSYFDAPLAATGSSCRVTVQSADWRTFGASGG